VEVISARLANQPNFGTAVRLDELMTLYARLIPMINKTKIIPNGSKI
jgi:hypothetical protein